MKAYIIHGWDGSPKEPMLQWIKNSLEARDYEVSVPSMPDPATPTIEAWVGKLKTLVTPSEDIIFIGHSIGCQAILRYLETMPAGKKVRGAVFIAPWMALDEKTIEEEGESSRAIAKPWVETPIDFQKVKSVCGKIIAIFSDNDPFVPLEQRTVFENELGAEIITEKHKGHFTAGDKITMLPSALNAALNL